MDATKLMVLLEIDDGSYHACQIGRGQQHNKTAMAAAEWLIKNGYVEWLGDELFLTQTGKDTINDFVDLARRA